MTESSLLLPRVQALLDVRRESDAIALLQQLLAAEPTDARAWRLLAYAHDQGGDHHAALDAANRALALDPEDEWGHRLASSALGGLRRWVPAAQAARAAVRLDPANWLGQAHLTHALMDHALYAPKIWTNGPLVRDARQAADRAVELAPDQPDAHYCRARLHQRLQKPKQARAGYRRVLELDPQHPGAITALGEITPSLSRSANLSATALHVEPRSTDAHTNLVQVGIRLLLGYWLLGLLLAFVEVVAGLTVRTPQYPPTGWLRALVVVVCLAVAVLPALVFVRRLDPPLRTYLLQLLRRIPALTACAGPLAAAHLTLIVLPLLPIPGHVLAIQIWVVLTVLALLGPFLLVIAVAIVRAIGGRLRRQR